MGCWGGLEAITVFLRDEALDGVTWRHVVTHANGQVAVACYLLADDGSRSLPGVIDVLSWMAIASRR